MKSPSFRPSPSNDSPDEEDEVDEADEEDEVDEEESPMSWEPQTDVSIYMGKHRKTKWNIKPNIDIMLEALRRVRVDKISSTVVSTKFGIPSRTLRRYVTLSKKSSNSLFYFKVEDEEDEEDEKDNEIPISWKPQTAVPMFCIKKRQVQDIKPDNLAFLDNDIGQIITESNITKADEEAFYNSFGFDNLFADFSRTFLGCMDDNYMLQPSPLLRSLSGGSCGSASWTDVLSCDSMV